MDIITANELISGAVVYPDSAGNWQQDIDKARVFGADETEARDALIVRAKATGRIVGIEIEAVKVENGKVVPDRLRERIRAEGPTAPYDNRRQELGKDGHVSL